jgi:AraC-like DNA-binding protein
MGPPVQQLPVLTELPSEIYFRYTEFGPGARTEPHAHDWGQLNFVTHGIMQLDVAGQRFISPPQYGVWIPPQVEHSTYNADATTYRSLYVALHLARQLPSLPCTLAISPILRAILSDFAARDVSVPVSAEDQRLAQVALDQLKAARPHDAYLPYAASPELQAMLQALREAPGDQCSLAGWAARFNMTARTLERRCARELGMSLGEWRRRLRFTLAIDALEAGRSIQQIAFDLGYGTASSFIVMFRRAAGTTPEQYRAQRAAPSWNHLRGGRKG